MEWDWQSILASIPDEKKQRYESLRYRTNSLPSLPTIEKKAIVVSAIDIDSVLLKAFEESYVSFNRSYFETRLKRLEKQLQNRQLYDLGRNYLVYFPGAHLYLKDAETDQYLGRFRVVHRETEEGFFGA